jgi:hypothetical protein
MGWMLQLLFSILPFGVGDEACMQYQYVTTPIQLKEIAHYSNYEPVLLEPMRIFQLKERGK